VALFDDQWYKPRVFVKQDVGFVKLDPPGAFAHDELYEHGWIDPEVSDKLVVTK
jgi:hypothetical protein